MTISLVDLTPAEFEAWSLVFELEATFGEDWVVVGGQMVHLHAAELGLRQGVRPTVDVDVIVDIRARRSGTVQLAEWLVERGFELAGIGATGIGHRYERRASPGPGCILFDVLAPEGTGERSNRETTPPARTVEVPGGTQALERGELVDVATSDLTGDSRAAGRVRRPNLLGALVAKAAATTIAVRHNPDRDWQDAALLLAGVPDPFALVPSLSTKDRGRLRRLDPLKDRRHQGWSLLSDADHRLGSAALDILLG